MTSRHTLVIVDHPYTLESWNGDKHRRSFTTALAHSAIEKMRKRGETVDIIDLHADGFDPVMHADNLVSWRTVTGSDPHIADYQQRITQADRIAFFFPIWWELMPAMTKGFIDKVYAKNTLYDQSEKRMTTLLEKNPEIIVTTVMSTPLPLYKMIFGNPITKALKRGTFWKTGLKKYQWNSFNGVDTYSEEKRHKIIDTFDI